jgi:hypothetical protein
MAGTLLAPLPRVLVLVPLTRLLLAALTRLLPLSWLAVARLFSVRCLHRLLLSSVTW